MRPPAPQPRATLRPRAPKSDTRETHLPTPTREFGLFCFFFCHANFKESCLNKGDFGIGKIPFFHGSGETFWRCADVHGKLEHQLGGTRMNDKIL